MITKDDFFIKENEIIFIPDENYASIELYEKFFDAFARCTYKSIYVIDYYKKNFLYVSENPLFLCGKTPKEVLEMGYEFYMNNVPKSNLPLLLEINRAGFKFAEKLPIESRLEYTLSYDFQITQPNGKDTFINHKITPIKLTDDGKVWLALCSASLSAHSEIGNIEVFKKGCDTRWKYNIETHKWKEYEGTPLNNNEKDVLFMSAQGYTTNDISKLMFKSVDTIKGYKRQIFEKLGVANTIEAISIATNQKWI